MTRATFCFGPILIALAVAACSTHDSPTRISLATLAADQHEYAGTDVVVSGRVRQFTEPNGDRYFVIEDAAAHRVLLVPADVVAPFDGTAVCVSGRFDLREELGRTIAVREIQLNDGGGRSCPFDEG